MNQASLKLVKTFPTIGIWTGLLYLNNINAAYIIFTSRSVLIDPLIDMEVIEEWIKSCGNNASLKSLLPQLFEQYCTDMFQRQLIRDSKKGILIGNIEDRTYDLYVIPDFENLSVQQVDNLIAKLKSSLGPRESIINIPSALPAV